MKKKTLKISPETHARLMAFGRKNETLDQVIARLLDLATESKSER